MLQVRQRSALNWKDSPRALAVGGLYVIALQQGAIEIQSLSFMGGPAATQIVYLPNMTLAAPAAASDGSLFVSGGGEGSIFRLAPVPLRRQAQLLAKAGDYAGALELAAGVEEQEVKQQLTDELRMRYGHHLFECERGEELG